MLSTNDGDDHDRMYYSYADKSFTTLTKPRLFHDRGIAMIDCHIDWNDCDRQYHIFYKREGADADDRGIYEAVFDKLGTWQWRDIFHITNEGRNNVEGPSAFRLINENKWKVGYIRYSGGKSYKLCDANATLEEIGPGIDIGTEELRAQHGSFMTLTKDEYDLLQAWSDLKTKVADAESNNPKAAKSKKIQNAKKVLEQTFEDSAIASLLKLYKKTLNGLK